MLIQSVPLALWLACANASTILPDQILQAQWGTWMGVAAIVLSMIVNALMTGLIVFRILKVKPFTRVKPELHPSGDPLQTLSSLGSYSGFKYWSVLSIIIESGMALFCVQLIRVVLQVIDILEMTSSDVPLNALEIVIPIHEILNVSTIKTSIITTSYHGVCVGYNTYYHLSAGLNGVIFLRREIPDRIYRREFTF